MRYLVGTSGWQYDDWRGVFYPAALPRARWLSYYATQFPTLEVNSTFYRLPQATAFQCWAEAAPPGFHFALKASRFITHIQRLRGVGEPLQEFVRRAAPLQEKLGPLLYQLPPTLRRDDALLAGFLAALPPGHRHALEFRHPSWFADEVYAALHKHNVAFCLYDMPGVTTPLITTADFAYLRFHGRVALYTSSYTEGELAKWAREVRTLPAATTYIYFNNDAGGAAVQNARTLASLLGG